MPAMRRFAVAALWLALPALAQDLQVADAGTPPPVAEQKPPEEPKGPFAAGRVVFRGGASLDLNQSINLGGTNSGARVGGGVNAGVGYYVIDNLSLDTDAHLHFLITPAPALTDLGVTPGMRFHFLPQAYVRAGVPIEFLPTFGLGVLGGAGYYQALGEKVGLTAGVDYTYYLTEAFQRAAPLGRVDLHGGIQTHF
jgi:hypothetical protein